MKRILIFYLLDGLFYVLVFYLLALKEPYIFYAFWKIFAIVLLLSLLPAHLIAGHFLHALGAAVFVLFVVFMVAQVEYVIRAYVPRHSTSVVDGLIEEQTKVGGRRHGKTTYRREDGTLVWTETWRDGTLDGEWTGYHDNGRKAERGVMRRVKREGEFRDLRFGTWKFYREDGTLDDVRDYEADSVLNSRNYRLYRLLQDDPPGLIFRFEDGAPFSGTLDRTPVVDAAGPLPLHFSGEVSEGVLRGPWEIRFHGADSLLHAEGCNDAAGRPEGPYREYFPNGQLCVRTAYRQGRLDGPYEAFRCDSAGTLPHGRLECRLLYRDGLRCDTARWYNEAGRLSSEEVYREGLLHGTCLDYWDDGTLHRKTPYVNGKKHGTCLLYWDNGSLREKTPYVDGKKHGTCLLYRDDGSLREKTSYVDGKEHGIRYEYSDGCLREEIGYRNGLRHGPRRSYDSKGRLKLEELYRDDLLQSEVSFDEYYPHSRFYTYDSAGRPTLTRTFEKGVRSFEQHYDSDGSYVSYEFGPDGKTLSRIMLFDTTGTYIKDSVLQAGQTLEGPWAAPPQAVSGPAGP